MPDSQLLGMLSAAVAVHRYRVPALLAVGLEGFWGLVLSAIALPILGVVRGSDGFPLDSAKQAFQVRAGASEAAASPGRCIGLMLVVLVGRKYASPPSCRSQRCSASYP